jgi:hypothetical protein
MSRIVRMLCVVVVGGMLALALATPAAHAASGGVGNPVINDCEHNPQLTHAWTLSQLREALKVMPADVKEYSGCYDIIEEAILKDRRPGTGGGSGGSSGGSFLPTPVIVILVILILVALGFGAMALRGRGRGDPPT